MISYDKELEALVSKKLEKDGMVGMAVAGGAALAVGGRDLSKPDYQSYRFLSFSPPHLLRIGTIS